MALVDTKNTKKLHPAFNGMNDRQIAAIYREDRISMLQPGDILFREGESNDSILSSVANCISSRAKAMLKPPSPTL
jgi:hypothetical protein